MPELPEVETIKRDLQKKIKSKKIRSVVVNIEKILKKTSWKELVSKVENRIIQEIHRRGKYIIIDLDSKEKLIIHLGMTGLFIYPYNKKFALKEIDPKHNHLIFTFADDTQLVFNDVRRFGKVYLVCDINEVEGMAKLGIEPLGENFKKEVFIRMMRKKKNKIKSLLMKQEFIAGLGNIYVNEVLYRANMHPLRVASSLTDEEIGKLFREIKCVLSEAVESRGSTVADEAYRDTDGEKGKFAEKLQIYARKGEPCIKCGSIIEVIKIEGRSTFICPQCQKLLKIR